VGATGRRGDGAPSSSCKCELLAGCRSSWLASWLPPTSSFDNRIRPNPCQGVARPELKLQKGLQGTAPGLQHWRPCLLHLRGASAAASHHALAGPCMRPPLLPLLDLDVERDGDARTGLARLFNCALCFDDFPIRADDMFGSPLGFQVASCRVSRFCSGEAWHGLAWRVKVALDLQVLFGDLVITSMEMVSSPPHLPSGLIHARRKRQTTVTS
jgi:hypothetical protein